MRDLKNKQEVLMNMRKIFLPLVFISVINIMYLYGECIWRVVEEKIYKNSCGTNCTASKDGNCYQWEVSYCTSTQKDDVCKDNCSLKECKHWEEKTSTYDIGDCIGEFKCCAYSGPELNASCVKKILYSYI